MNACSERNPLSIAADRICCQNLSVGNARLRSILCFRMFDPPHFCLWRICGATTEKAPQRSYLIAPDLAPETRDATPPFFMFQSGTVSTDCGGATRCHKTPRKR